MARKRELAGRRPLVATVLAFGVVLAPLSSLLQGSVRISVFSVRRG